MLGKVFLVCAASAVAATNTTTDAPAGNTTQTPTNNQNTTQSATDPPTTTEAATDPPTSTTQPSGNSTSDGAGAGSSAGVATTSASANVEIEASVLANFENCVALTNTYTAALVDVAAGFTGVEITQICSSTVATDCAENGARATNTAGACAAVANCNAAPDGMRLVEYNATQCAASRRSRQLAATSMNIGISQLRLKKAGIAADTATRAVNRPGAYTLVSSKADDIIAGTASTFGVIQLGGAGTTITASNALKSAVANATVAVSATQPSSSSSSTSGAATAILSGFAATAAALLF